MLVITLLLLVLVRISSSKTSPFRCTETGGWISKGRKCYKWGPSPQDFDDAARYCRKQGARIQLIENEEENNFFKDNSSSTNYWLGLTEDYKTPSIPNYYTNWKESNSQYQYFRRYCAVWGSTTGYWYTTSCDNLQLFLCEKTAECIKGRFGDHCSKTCHCHGEPCFTKSGSCKYGCRKGWMGTSCHIPKTAATALYYCLNSPEHGSELIVRVDQHGIDYKEVLALDENGVPLMTCNKSAFSAVGGKLQLTVRNTPASKTFRPDCGAQRISDNIFKWRFRFVEFSGTLSIYDVIFEVRCDFDEADNLQRGSLTNNKKNKMKVRSLKKTDLQVELSVRDPYSGRLLTKARHNHNAMLVLQLNSTDEETAVKKISPHSCLVGTEDGVNEVVFLDHNGCTNGNAPIIFSEGNGTSWWSKPFQTFTFPGYNHIVFSCQFDLCFTNDDRLCGDRCAFLKETSISGQQTQTVRGFLTGSNHTTARLNVL